MGVTGFGLSCDVEDKTKVSFRVVLKKGRKKTLSCLFLSGSFFKGQINSSHAEWLGYAIYNMEHWRLTWTSHLYSRFYFLEHRFQCKNRLLKMNILLAYFRDSGKRHFYIPDPWLSIFSGREPCQRPPVRPSASLQFGQVQPRQASAPTAYAACWKIQIDNTSKIHSKN